MGHKGICERFIINVLGVDNPNNVNTRELKCDYALKSSKGIECFEVVAGTKTSNEAHLHTLGHLAYMIILNCNQKEFLSYIGWSDQAKNSKNLNQKLIIGQMKLKSL